jgi:hypothetical protein
MYDFWLVVFWFYCVACSLAKKKWWWWCESSPISSPRLTCVCARARQALIGGGGRWVSACVGGHGQWRKLESGEVECAQTVLFEETEKDKRKNCREEYLPQEGSG